MFSPDNGGLLWFKSSHSAANGSCVEVADRSPAIHVRDSKDPQGPVLTFDHTAWASLVDSINADRITR